MSDPRTTLLAGIAAVALVTGCGLATAREPSKGEGTSRQGAAHRVSTIE